MNDRPGILERVAHAHHSSDLRHKEKPCDVDKLSALGMVSVSRPIASHLMSLKYDNNPKAYRPALEQLQRIVCGIDRRWRWRAAATELDRLARVTLNYWVDPKCRKCTGIGFLKVEGAPVLQPKPCPACRGSTYAKPKLPRSMPPNPWDARVTIVLGWLDAEEQRASWELMTKLSNALSGFQGVR